MRKITILLFFVALAIVLAGPLPAVAKTPQPALSASPSAQVAVLTPEPVKSDITQKTEAIGINLKIAIFGTGLARQFH